MKRVQVDFSTTARHGMMRANLKRVEPTGATLERGERVEAFDPDEGISFEGVVEEVDGRFAYLRMEWVDVNVPINEPGRNLLVDFSAATAVTVVRGSQTSLVGDDEPPVRPPRITPPPIHLPQPEVRREALRSTRAWWQSQTLSAKATAGALYTAWEKWRMIDGALLHEH